MSAASQLLAWGATLAFASLAAFLAVRGGRRRSAINEAIHEVRRPLQALALSGPAAGGVWESSVRMAATALARLEREVNGGEEVLRRETVRCEELVRAAVLRWQVGAAVEGSELSLSWNGGEAAVDGDPSELGQALDNLIVNAIEHGGPRITVAGHGGGERVRLAVADSGPAIPRPALRGDAFSVAIERFSGRRRRGHGLAIVRRIASRHGGRFVLERTGQGSRAVLDLPRARSQRPG